MPHTDSNINYNTNSTIKSHKIKRQNKRSEQGNMLFMILIAIVLIGLLSAAIMSGNGGDGSNIDKETLIIRASETQRYASEIERGILYIMQNNKSESDIRFAHPDAPSDYGDLSADSDPTDQLFHRDGGAVRYRSPPSGINDGSSWEFYGSTNLPGVGSDAAELVAVLPNVTQAFCDKINEINGQNGTPTDDNSDPGPTCINSGTSSRFDDGQQFYTGTNVNNVLSATFTQDTATSAARTALQACVKCSDSSLHFYHVIMAR